MCKKLFPQKILDGNEICDKIFAHSKIVYDSFVEKYCFNFNHFNVNLFNSKVKDKTMKVQNIILSR